MFAVPSIWFMAGVTGQVLFGLRFAVQWIASERAGKSVIPPSFWYLSVPAGVFILAYVIWRRDPVLIISESICLAVFVRNVIMLHKSRSDRNA